MAESSSNLSIHSTGLSVVYESHQPEIDIVFVHGFKGHPERTWVQKTHCDETEDHSERAPKRQKIGFIPRRSKNEHDVAIFWPRDLLPKVIPNVRVLTYGYDTKIQHVTGPPVSTHTVYDIAGDFLVALEAERRQEPARPLLFIVHSLGGIVVKEMLRHANTNLIQEHLSSTVQNVQGIIFFGTPHSGADPRSLLLKVAEKAYRAVGFSPNEQVVDALLPSSERLRELRDTFGILAEKKGWKIHSFQEQYAVKAINCKVVEDGSSYLNLPSLETTEHIGRDHMGMSRFSGLNDPEFKKVAAALQRMTQAPPESAPTAIHTPTAMQVPTAAQAGLDEFLEFLRFDQIDARHDSIKKAHAKTCKWLPRNPQYVAWLDPTRLCEHHGFLWIKGKPGTGKSTIMKYALGHLKKTRKDRTILNFFFNARGEELEKSTHGLYRSLLLQLLQQCPELQATVEQFIKPRPFMIHGEGDRKPGWSIELLKTAFEHAIQAMGQRSVTCIIDALDECDEAEVRDMVSFFEQLGELSVAQTGKISICLSSRHYPHITIRHGVELVLDGHEGHVQDIVDYIQSELNIGHSKLAAKIREELQEKASGVFMWVVLVVDILNREHDRGRIHLLQRRLRELPANLHKLFRDILQRDTHGKKELLLCMQWVLFARKPLKPEQLYYAILSGSDPEALSPYGEDMIGVDDMKRFIVDCSKGLAETTKSKAATVQFIHESVRDFLVKDNGLIGIWPSLQNGLEGQSHDELKNCCMKYLSIDVSGHLEAQLEAHMKASGFMQGSPYFEKEQQNQQRSLAFDAFPFLEYAVRNVLYHTDKAEELKTCQKEFMKSFPLDRWIQQHNIVEKHTIRKYTNDTRLLYILSEHGFASLIPREFSIAGCVLNAKNERHHSALGAALAAGNGQTVQVLRKALIACLPLADDSRRFLLDSGHPDHSIWNKMLKDRSSTCTHKLVADANDPALFSVYFCAWHYYSRPPISLRSPEWNSMRNVSACTIAALNHISLLRILSDFQKYGFIHLHGFPSASFVDPIPSLGSCPAIYLITSCYPHYAAMIDMPGREDGKVLTAASSAVREEVAVTQWTRTTTTRLVVEICPRAIAYSLHQGHTSVNNIFGLIAPKDYRMVLPQITHYVEEFIVEGGRLNSKLSLGSPRIILPNFHVDGGAWNFPTIDKDALWFIATMSVFANDCNTFRACIETGNLDIDTQVDLDKRRTLLHLASFLGSDQIVREIIDMKDAQLDCVDSHGNTPLNLAAFEGHREVVRLLLETRRVKPNLAPSNERTILHLASFTGRHEFVQLLLEREEVNPNSVDSSGDTPLHDARNEATAKPLLEQDNIDPNIKNILGDTPLHNAVRRGDTAQVKLLLDHVKVDPNLANLIGETPLHGATRRRGGANFVPLLLKHVNINPNLPDVNGDTPLHFVAALGKEEIAKLLLEHTNIDPNIPNHKGETPVSLARKEGHSGILDLLLRAGAVDSDG